MKRRYLALFAIALGLAALLTALGRGAKHAPPPPPASAPAPLVQIRIELRNGVVSPPLVDRPGDDFPWLVDGRPSGRFVVAGSHLEDGRR